MQISLILAAFGVISLALCSITNGAEVKSGPATINQAWATFLGTKGPGKGKHVVLISGDEEYRSEEALSQLGKILSKHHGFTCTELFAIDPGSGFVDPNQLSNIPGLEALRTADLMVIAIRFRNLPDGQMREINDYLKSGRPVLGMRTATHAFRIAPANTNWAHYDFRYSGPKKEWTYGFGRLVLGESWVYHYGYHNHQSTRGLITKEQQKHPILRGLKDGDIWGPTDVYAVRLPLPGDSVPLVLGQTMNRKGPFQADDMFLGMRPTDDEVAGKAHNPTADTENRTFNPNDPMMPVAWTKSYQLPEGKKGRVFATTMGAATDLVSEGTRRMLVNAVYWCVGLEKKIPAKGAKVNLVGDYQPTQYLFRPRDYWIKKEMRPFAFQAEQK